MRAEIKDDSCGCPDQTLFIGQGDISDLHLAMAVIDPCMAVSPWPRLDHPDSLGHVIVESDGCRAKPPPAVMKMGFTLGAASGEGESCVAHWRRSTNGPKRFCGSRGSPPD